MIYWPPSQSVATFIDEFGSFLKENALGGHPVIFACDFNLHWDKPNDKYVKIFRKLCDAFDLVQQVDSATHIKGHTLDFILSRPNDGLCVRNLQVGEIVFDHSVVSCDIAFRKPEYTKRTISYRNIKTIDIPLFRKGIANLPIARNCDI